MNSCKKIKLMISRNIDNDLNDNEIKYLRNHIESCKECGNVQLKYNDLENILKYKTIPEYDGNNKFIFNKSKIVRSIGFKKIIVACSCIVILFLASMITIQLVKSNYLYANNSSIEEPLGYLTYTENDTYKTADNDDIYKPMKTYFSYVDYEQ